VRFNVEYQEALGGRVEMFRYGFSENETLTEMENNLAYYGINTTTLPKSLEDVFNFHPYGDDIRRNVTSRMPTRVAITGVMLFKRRNPKLGQDEYFTHYEHGLKYNNILNASDIDPMLKEEAQAIDNEIEQCADSVEFLGYLGIHLKFMVYQPLGGGSYIELPADIKNKKAIINIKNEDDKCFLYSLALGMAKEKPDHPERVTVYKGQILDSVKIPVGCSFPPKESDWPKWEKLNNLKLSILYLELDPLNEDRRYCASLPPPQQGWIYRGRSPTRSQQ